VGLAVVVLGMVSLRPPTAHAGSAFASGLPPRRCLGGARPTAGRPFFVGRAALPGATTSIGDLAQVSLAVQPVLDEAPPVETFEPLDNFVYWVMSFDESTNQAIEFVIFGLAIILTVVAAKQTYDQQNSNKTDDESELQDKLKRAMAEIEPERKFRRASSPEVGQGDEMARSTAKKKIVNFADTESDMPKAAATNRVRGKMKRKSPLQEATELENELPEF